MHACRLVAEQRKKNEEAEKKVEAITAQVHEAIERLKKLDVGGGGR